MKLMVVFLIAAMCHVGLADTSKSKEKKENNTDKRELEEGNASIEKRAPVLPTAPSEVTPGVEYADTKETLSDKSPAQQIYATPQPPIAKISDVLTGQGPPFQAAIASHLYSPVSIYQPRISSPTTFEVAPPIPSQLAYSEHLVQQQRFPAPATNSLQYNVKPQRISNQKIKQAVEIQKSYEPANSAIPQILQQIPNNHLFLSSPYNQFPQPLRLLQQLPYYQQQIQPQPGILYYNDQQSQQNLPTESIKHQQPEQRDLRTQPATSQLLVKQPTQQEYTNKQQGPISYATFSYNPASQPYEQLQQISQPQLQQISHPQLQQISHPQLQQISQPQLQQISQPQFQQTSHPQLQQISQPQLQQISQPQLQQISQPQLQQISQPQLQAQPQFQYQLLHPQTQVYNQAPQQQIQYQLPPPQYVDQYQQFAQYQQSNLQQTQPQRFTNEQPSQNFIGQQEFRHEPTNQQLSAVYPQQIQSLGYREPLAAPTFPPVQYFGKFAQSIFSRYQHK